MQDAHPTPPTPISRTRVASAAAIALAAGLALAACESGPRRDATHADGSPIVDLSDLLAGGTTPAGADTTPADPEAQADIYESDLQRQLRAQQNAMRLQDTDTTPSNTDAPFRLDPVPFTPPSRARRTDTSAAATAPTTTTEPAATGTTTTPTTDDANGATEESQDQPAAPIPGAEPADQAERARTLAVELADILRRQSPATTDNTDAPAAADPFATALRLAFLDAIEPGSASLALADAVSRLDPVQRDLLDAIRAAVADVADPAAAADLDPDALAERFRDAAAQLVDPPLSMPAVELCTRVESFGRFNPLPNTRFLVGRSTPVLVYAEVDNFEQRPPAAKSASDADTPAYEVRLSIELGIYPESGDPLIYRYPPATVRDASNRPRRDFFLVRRIDVPSNLNVGNYLLKVTLHDEHSGDLAEQTLRFSVVADPGLLGIDRKFP